MMTSSSNHQIRSMTVRAVCRRILRIVLAIDILVVTAGFLTHHERPIVWGFVTLFGAVSTLIRLRRR